MKEDHPGELGKSAKELVEQLEEHPPLRECVEAILAIVEQEGGQCARADAAELALLEEMRKLGRQALTEWADHGQSKALKEARAENPGLKSHQKKSSNGFPSSESRKQALVAL